MFNVETISRFQRTKHKLHVTNHVTCNNELITVGIQVQPIMEVSTLAARMVIASQACLPLHVEPC